MQWRFALKYLTSRKSHSVINIIATVSLFAVVVPVAAMVILLSVFNGFESLVRDLYKVIDADIEVTSEHSISTSDVALRQRIEGVEGVKALSFVVERQALLSYRDNRVAVQLRGVDEGYKEVVPIERYTSLGNCEVQLGELDRLMLGEGVAYELGMFSMAAGDVEVYSLGGGHIGSLLPTFALHSEKLDVCGTLVIDQQHASSFALTSLRAANRIFGAEERADKALVKVSEDVPHRKVADELQRALGEEYKVVLREDKNESFYAIMRYEKWAIFFVSVLVLVVASLSIIGTVIMLVIEKQDERLTLRSMGADNGFIRGVFVREGLLIAGVGGAIGLLLGVAITLAQQHYGFVKMPNSSFLVENYPVELQATDLIVIFVVFVAVALAVSVVATSTMIKRR
ncbi:MAG: ABC transporter permease [Alistipes sp.]|nr:ABC transporter permease [Alistipes sp.]